MLYWIKLYYAHKQRLVLGGGMGSHARMIRNKKGVSAQMLQAVTKGGGQNGNFFCYILFENPNRNFAYFISFFIHINIYQHTNTKRCPREHGIT